MADAPVDIEAEQVVLASCLLDINAINIVSDLVTEKDFYIEPHRLVYRSILSLQKDGVAIDQLTVKAELERKDQLEKVGGLPGLMRITDGIPRIENVKHHCAIVRRMAAYRSIMQMAVGVHGMAAGKDIAPQDLIEKIQGHLMTLYGRFQSEGPVHIAEIAQRGFQEIEARKNNPDKVGLQTGFRDLDYILGSMRPQNLIVLAARPGGGKTALAVNIAVNVAKAGARVAIFSLEMSNTELYCRMVGTEADMSVGSLLSGRFHKDHWPAIAAASDTLSQQTILIDDSGHQTLLQIGARAKRIAAEHGLDLIIVDYLQLIDGPGKSQYEKVTAISRGLKSLAKDLNIPVVALAQLNRLESETDEPQLHNLRDSGSIEQDADAVIFLWAGDSEDVRKCKVAKQRNGPLGKFNIGFDSSETRFYTCVQSSFGGE